MTSLLLKGGNVLIHDTDDKVTPTRADVLVEGSRITKIEPSITAPDGCEVIDCTDKIVSPGLIDTHHHMWQSPLKGLFGDSAFVPYMALIMAAGDAFTAQDFFWANLAGNMEALDAGTTSALDHAHMNFSPAHSKHAIGGSLSSGIRSIFAYSPTMGLDAAKKPEMELMSNPMPDWVMETFEELAKSQPLADADSRVRLGLGFDLYFFPEQVIKGIFDKVRSLGASIVTSHYNRFCGEESHSIPVMLKNYGLLDDRIVLSHSGGATLEDSKLMTAANAFVSVTPSTEQAMAVGPPVAFREDLPGIDKICSIGVDSHGITGGSLVNEMRNALQSARGRDSAAHNHRGTLPKEIYHTTLEAFNMGTIQGARALCMEEEIGSIAVGKKADLVVFDAMSPAMIGVAQLDPVMAIILHSSIGDVNTVVVDGLVRKREGKMLPVKTSRWQGENFVETDETVAWSEVAAKVLDTQSRLMAKLPEYDLPKLASTIATAWKFPV